MAGAKEKGAEGAMLGQCHAALGMPFAVAVSLEL